MKLRALVRSLTCLFSALFATSPGAQADGMLHELKIGVLAHDVPDLWSGFRVEDDFVALNVEATLSPSLPFLGGTIRPAIGAPSPLKAARVLPIRCTLGDRNALRHLFCGRAWCCRT